MDMNGDGYIGGQGNYFLYVFHYILSHYSLCFPGLEGNIERATHIDFNGDGIIGRLPDTIPGGGGFPPMNYGNVYGGFPPAGYNGPGFF